MKALFGLIFLICLCINVAWCQTVLGVEANGPDSATISAFEWRKTNVYDAIYTKAGFKVVLISQSSKAKVEEALNNNAITHITGCGHGSPTVYTGYNQGVVFSTSDTPLLAKLAGKNIHLLSCLTAQELGPMMIEKKAKSFAGYHPSFYFTWKSTALFFEADAAMDKAFAANKTAPQAYTETIQKFNEVMEILKTQDPDAVKYIVIDRDGLRCLPAREYETTENILPLEVATNTLFSRDSERGGFITFAEFQNQQMRYSYRDMNEADFKEMVLAGYERLSPEFELGILSYGKFNRNQIIEEIKQDTEVGKQLVEADKQFLNTVSESRWSQTIEVSTDANGNIEQVKEFDVPMTITTKQVKATWSGEPNNFQNVSLIFNGDTLFDGAVVNGTSYSIVKKVNKGHVSASVKAVGGPKNTKIKVTLYFDLG